MRADLDEKRRQVGQVGEDRAEQRVLPESEHTPDQREALANAKGLVEELGAADVVVLAVPFHNFGVSQHFKTWVDLVIAGAGPTTPVLKGKPTVLATVRGGYGLGTPREGWDHSTPYLRRILADLREADLTVIERELTRSRPPPPAWSACASSPPSCAATRLRKPRRSAPTSPRPRDHPEAELPGEFPPAGRPRGRAARRRRDRSGAGRAQEPARHDEGPGRYRPRPALHHRELNTTPKAQALDERKIDRLRRKSRIISGISIIGTGKMAHVLAACRPDAVHHECSFGLLRLLDFVGESSL